MIAYLATPIDLYQTERYVHGRALAFARWPGAAWIEPARMSWDNEAWRREWRVILPELHLLAVIPRDNMSIGRGCWKEITDCQRCGVPVYVLAGQRWRKTFEIVALPGDSYRHWAKVRV